MKALHIFVLLVPAVLQRASAVPYTSDVQRHWNFASWTHSTPLVWFQMPSVSNLRRRAFQGSALPKSRNTAHRTSDILRLPVSPGPTPLPVHYATPDPTISPNVNKNDTPSPTPSANISSGPSGCASCASSSDCEAEEECIDEFCAPNIAQRDQSCPRSIDPYNPNSRGSLHTCATCARGFQCEIGACINTRCATSVAERYTCKNLNLGNIPPTPSPNKFGLCGFCKRDGDCLYGHCIESLCAKDYLERYDNCVRKNCSDPTICPEVGQPQSVQLSTTARWVEVSDNIQEDEFDVADDDEDNYVDVFETDVESDDEEEDAEGKE